jgi:sugar phosphate isomerase/epimerase
MKALEDKALWPETEKEVRAAGQLLAALGAKYLVLIDDTHTNLFTGEPVAPARLDRDGWKRLVETTNRIADLARDRFGLTVVFHPHADSHVEYEDQIEALLADTDAKKVFLCLDTGHHAYRDGDPVKFMRRHSERIAYLRLKEPSISRRFETSCARSTTMASPSSSRTCTRHSSRNPCQLPNEPVPTCEKLG